MFKVVKSAQIEIVEPSELRVGDYILFKNLKVKIININKLNRIIRLLNPFNSVSEGHVMTLNYYKIISCEEVEAPENKEEYNE